MDYFVSELLEEDVMKGLQKNAGGKARDDVRNILIDNGMKEISIIVSEVERERLSILNRIKSHFDVKNKWIKALAAVDKGDYLFIQYPIRDHTVFCGTICKYISQRGVNLVLIIHDLNILRDNKKDIGFKKKIRYYLEESAMLKGCSFIIAHNDKMISALVEQGIDRKKMISLELFDYLSSAGFKNNSLNVRNEKHNRVVIAGNLDKNKAGYVYLLKNPHITWNVYGVNFSISDNNQLCYKGSFLPDELPGVMEGDFGLVWDGNSVDSCKGAYGEYLRINNPHKTSLYLAAGLPVLIWKEAALADFVEKKGCGLVINKIEDIDEIVTRITDEEYQKLKESAYKVAKQVRSGYYTMHAIEMIKNDVGVK